MDANNPSGLVPQATFPGLLGARLQAAVERALPWYVLNLLRVCPKAFISGGFIRDASVRVPYHDIDIYLGGEDMERASNWLMHLQPDYLLARETDRGRTFDCPVTNFNTDGTAILWETRPVQLLHSRAPDFTVNEFDLINCQAWYMPAGTPTLPSPLNWHDGFPTAVSTGISGARRFNPRTYHRMERMKEQGWKFVEGDTWQAYDCFMANGGGRDSG